MSNTQQLEISFKRLILRPLGLYLTAGLSLYLLNYLLHHPQSIYVNILQFVSDSLFNASNIHVSIAWFLISFLSAILMFNLLAFVSRRFKLFPAAVLSNNMPYGLFDMMAGKEKNIEIDSAAKTSSKKDSKDNPGKLNGMLMVADGKIMFVNKDFCQITGYAPAEIIGRDFIDFVVPQDLIKYAGIVRTSKMESLGNESIGIITQKKNQLEVFVAGNKNVSSNPIDICLFHVRERSGSVTRKLSMAEMLIDSLGKANANFWTWDDKGMIFISPNCRNQINVPLGLLTSKPLFMLKAVDKSDRIPLLAAYKKYLKTQEFEEDVRITNLLGEVRWYRVKMTPNFDNTGKVGSHVAVAFEITQQKKHFDELETTCEEAIAANYNKTTFLANMSHEIRSPLNGILGFSELLTDPDLPGDERERYVEIIKSNSMALLSILNDIIDISKLESGKLRIIEKEFKPADLLNDLQLHFSHDPLVTHKGLNLKWTVNEDLAKAVMISDPFRIRQVLVNLITNALKFTHKGRVEVVAERWDDKAVFWVKDTGIGMSEDNLPFIFDRYRQVSRNDSSHSNGFGLGLAITKALVELLGGNIWVESNAGHGTVFYFTIPYKTPKQANMSNTNSTETAFPYDWKGRTILIAEDIDFSFLYIEAVLRRTGARVLWAQNGREAIEMVKVNPGIDIALMDIHMPIMNGYDATREIMKIRPDLPVIAQTAFVLPDDVKTCYAAGCAGYLAKPIRREQLLNTLTDYFEKIDQRKREEAGEMPVYKSKVSC